jgi:Icc protein
MTFDHAMQPLRILQLTDSHLPDESGGRVQGLDTEGSLRAVLDQALSERPAYDLVLLTGDLVEQPTPSAYSLLRQLLRRVPVPTLCLPGNHDHPDLLRELLSGDSPAVEYTHSHGDWRILTLDSSVPGRSDGLLCDDQLERIASTIDDAPDQHLLVAVHHHPVACGSAWMDELMLGNGNALMDLLQKGGNGTRVVVFGHIHQAFDATVGRVRVLGAPATSCQFEPQSPMFRRSVLPPGYRWLELHPDGGLGTGVTYLDGAPGEQRQRAATMKATTGGSAI